MARFRRRRRRFFRRRFTPRSRSVLHVGRSRSSILGLSIPTLFLLGGLAFVFRNKLQPLFQKVISLFK